MRSLYTDSKTEMKYHSLDKIDTCRHHTISGILIIYIIEGAGPDMKTIKFKKGLV